MMRITIKQYAIFKGVSVQAVTHRLRKNHENGEPLHFGMTDIVKVHKLGRSYELQFNGYWDVSNPKKPKLKSNPYDHEKTGSLI